MTRRIRTAVIGTGHFGRFHANKYAELPQSELVALCDADMDRCRQEADRHGVAAIADYRELAGKVDAVSIVVPSVLHHEVGRFCLENGIHVLMEKPITNDPATARDLVDLAHARGLVLQVGHLERFLNVRMELQGILTRPLYIESTRVSAFNPRIADVGVILDMMIHDIDMILSLTGSPIESLEAIGTPVLSKHEDIANTRIRFKDGCVASVTGSRISTKSERRLRIFQPDAYISVDLGNSHLMVARKGEGEMFPGIPNVVKEEKTFPGDDPLRTSIASFLDCVATGKTPLVTGEDGLRALEAAIAITESLQSHLAFVNKLSS